MVRVLTPVGASARKLVRRGTGAFMQRASVAAGIFAATLLVSCTAARAADQGRPASFSVKGAQAGAAVKLRVVDADGHKSALFGPFTAGPDGRLSGTVPASITRDARVSADDFYRGTVDL